jgi:hypothetical protein
MSIKHIPWLIKAKLVHKGDARGLALVVGQSGSSWPHANFVTKSTGQDRAVIWLVILAKINLFEARFRRGRR